MANEPTITIVGNLTADPELRYTASGTAVTNFTLASTPRTFNKHTNKWDDGETAFFRCSVWREYAENVANTLAKGMRVVAHGRLTTESYEHNGETRTNLKIDIEAVGPDLRYATAQVTKATSSSAGVSNVSFDAPAGGSATDQWAQPAFNDTPPF